MSRSSRLSMYVLALGIFTGGTLAATAADQAPSGNPPAQPGGGPGGGGPGGGGPGGSGQRGPGGGGMHLIPKFAEEKLNLTADQQTQIAALEKDVKEKLAKILTPEQIKTLEESRPPRGGQGGGQGGQGGGQGGPGGGGQGGPGGGQGGPGGGQGGPGGGKGPGGQGGATNRPQK